MTLCGHPEGQTSRACNVAAIGCSVRRIRRSAAYPVRNTRMLVIASIAVLLVVAELLARAAGLHTRVLYEKTSYGYRVAPNQALERFGRTVAYNSQGLRSAPLPATGNELRVLCLGDSITNGGTLTDQADTYPSRLERELSAEAAGVRVLNA